MSPVECLPRRAVSRAALLALLAMSAACKATPFAPEAGAAPRGAAAPPMSADAGRPPSPPEPPTSPALTSAPTAAPIPIAPTAPAPTGAQAFAPATAPHTAATPAVAPVAAPAVAWPTTFVEFVSRLRADATSGRDPALAGHVDLLEAAARLGANASEETAIARVPELEASEQARFGHGTGWATVVSYIVTDAHGPGDAAALRDTYLDFDRVQEFTGKAGTRTVERRGDVVFGFTDGVRTALGMKFGARWAFEAHSIDRGDARLVASRQRDDPATFKMLSTRGCLVAFPEPRGVRIVECAASVIDFEVPPLIRNIAINAAIAEMKARANGVRSHWREYVGRR